MIESVEIKTGLDFILHFLPILYIKEIIIPATNQYANKQTGFWNIVIFAELMKVLVILLSM